MHSVTQKLISLYHRSRAASWKRRAAGIRRDLSDTIWSENKRIAWCERRMDRHLDSLRDSVIRPPAK